MSLTRRLGIMLTLRLLALTSVLSRVRGADFAQWCGKYYQYGSPADATSIPFGFPYPETSSVPLLDFHCTPRSSFYLENDGQYDPPTIIIDANITDDVGQTCECSAVLS